MRPFAAILLLAVIGVCSPGCSLFKKNTGGDSTPQVPPPPTAVQPPKFPTATDTKSDSKADPVSQAKGGNGLLAGRVIDGSSRPPGGTSILVIPADAKDDSAGREVSVSPEGYFTVENLKQGGQYKLVARGKQGDRAVAGVKYITAPNVRVLIEVREDLVNATTPAVQGPFGSLKDDKKFQPMNPPPKDSALAKESANGWTPTGAIDVAGGEMTLPAVRAPDTTPDSGFVKLPPLEIKNVRPPAEIAKILPPEVKANDPPAALGPTQVPSCVLVGRQLVNFALNDINGQPWELKKNRTGKLVLLDFWATYCVPCRQAMPALKGLQSRYGSQGLEVVGIAYERSGSPQEQAYRVNDVCQKLLINYRQLLGSGPSCVVQSQLGIRAYPTLVLLDEQGTIIWRHQGGLGPNDMEELERLIQSRLRTTTN